MENWLKSLNIKFIKNSNVFESDGPIAIKYIDSSISEDDSKLNHADYLNYLVKNKHLITILSNEWSDREEQYKNYISSILGIHSRKEYARKCEVKEVGKYYARQFIEHNHIQGANSLGIIFFGLLLSGELLGVISLGRHNRNVKANDTIILDRLCFKNGIHICGGASKLFSRCIDWAKQNKYDNIVSYSDNKWSQGGIYSILGFEIDEISNPDYFYIDKTTGQKLSKQSQCKKVSHCPEDLTEYEWAKQRNLERIWDCGKKRWIYRLHQEPLSYQENLARNTAIQNSVHYCSRRRNISGYFQSNKNNETIYFSSANELRFLYLAENDKNIISFGRCEQFNVGNGKWRTPDFKVEYANRKLEVIEVKPLNRLDEEEIVKQIEESKKCAKELGYSYRVWTEIDGGFKNDREMTNWAKSFCEEGKEFDTISKHHNAQQQKYYKNKVKQDKVDIWCDFCKENHNIMKLSYDLNVAKNNRYICIRENGQIVGKQSKKLKENPYILEGKKECHKCKQIKLYSEFNTDKSRSDKLCNICRECNRKRCLAHYEKKCSKKGLTDSAN